MSFIAKLLRHVTNYFGQSIKTDQRILKANIFPKILENNVKFIAPDIFFEMLYFQHTSPTGTGTIEYSEINLYNPYSTHFHSECSQGILLMRNQIPVAICSFQLNLTTKEILVYQIQTLGKIKSLFNQVDYPVWFLEILSKICLEIGNYCLKVQSASSNKWRIENNPVEENRHVHKTQILGSYDKAVQRFNKKFANQYNRIGLF